MARLHTPAARLLQERLAEAAVTVVRNDDDILPVRTLENKNFVSLSLGEKEGQFDRYLSRYAPVSNWLVRTPADTAGLTALLAGADLVVVEISSIGVAWKEFISGVRRRLQQKEVVVCNFGNPENLTEWEEFPTQIQIYSEGDQMPEVAAQVIFGGMASRGVLPIHVSATTPAGAGVRTATQDRLSYTVPEAAGLDSRILEEIPAIAREAIESKAMPGCRVLVAKDGMVVYDRSFGSLTYDNKVPVTEETIYDLASVTKVSATLQAVMYMYENGMIDLNKKISVYLPELKGSNKQDFILKDILTHQAGLWPFLPFWTQTMKDSLYLPEFYSRSENPAYHLPVSRNLFATNAMKDSLWQWIIKARIVDKPGRIPYDFRYSDMGFYVMQHLAEKLLNQPLEVFLEQRLYGPVGAYTTGYLPLRKFPESRIAPTEDDKTFRKSLLTGFVHDQGAAMQGGIAGHAGYSVPPMIWQSWTALAPGRTLWGPAVFPAGNACFIYRQAI